MPTSYRLEQLTGKWNLVVLDDSGKEHKIILDKYFSGSDGVETTPTILSGLASLPALTSIGAIGATLAILGLIKESFTDGITAGTTQTQVGATALTTEVSRVSTVGTALDGVKLPASQSGLTVFVINHGANEMYVYPATGEQIDDVVANSPVRQMVNSMVLYTCATTGNWYSNGIGTGFAGQYPTVSYRNGYTAATTQTQAAGTPITDVINRFTTVANDNDACTLPLSFGGMQITVSNASAKILGIFPGVGDAINALSANAVYALAAGKTAQFTCAVAGNWHAVLSA